MAAIETRGVEDSRPSHPGLLIRSFLMNNLKFTLRDVANELGTTPFRAERIISESEPFTAEDAKGLKEKFSELALILLRLQYARDFFDKNHRRPNRLEKEEIIFSLHL